MKIGLLGGSFDPVHLGHISIAKEAIVHLDLDRFYFIPTKNNPWKSSSVADANDRVEMLRIAILDESKMDVSTIEIDMEHDNKNYTFDTLSRLLLNNPDDEFYYLMGMDQVIQFDKWYKADKISEMVQLIAFNRGGYIQNHINIEKYNFIKMDNTQMLASSTEIKEGNLSILDKSVLKYISKTGIYLDLMIKNRMSKKRYDHTLSVAKLTKELCEANGIDGQKGYIAGIMHDIAKEMPFDIAEDLMKKYYPTHLNDARPIWHQWLSSYIAKNEFLIEDVSILEAIEDHTTASIRMSTLSKCLYCADKLDPLRGYDVKDDIELCKENIDEGFKKQLKNFYEFSQKKKRKIDDIFYEVYKKYVGEI